MSSEAESQFIHRLEELVFVPNSEPEILGDTFDFQTAEPRFINDEYTEPAYSEDKQTEAKRGFRRKIATAALTGGILVSVAFQQSPGNEAFRTAAAMEVLEETQDEIAVGGAVAGITMAIEGSTSALIALGLNQERGSVKRLIQRFKKKSAPNMGDPEDDAKPSKMSSLANVGIALGVGPGIAVAKRHLEEAEPHIRKDMSRALGYSALGSAVSGGIGYLVAGGIKHADKVGLETPAEYFVDYATDWKFWTGLVVGGYALKTAKNKVQSLLSRKDNSEQELL